MEQALLERSDGVTHPLPAWIVLTVLSGVAFTSNANISILLPIMPDHFAVIGVSKIWCGILFSCFPVAVLVFSPITLAAIARWGRVPVLTFGLVLQGISLLAFGCADQIASGIGQDPSASLAIYTLSRLACGAGCACANNAIFAIAADRFPNDLGMVMGLNEVLIGAGFSLGPPIGLALYLNFGFTAPFLAGGAAIVIFSPFALMLKQPLITKAQNKAGDGLFAVLKPGLLVSAGCVFFGTGVFGVIEPLLSLYLKDEIGVPVNFIGGVFAVFAGTYSVLGFVMGALSDRIGALRVCSMGILASGLLMAGMLGPEDDSMPKGSNFRIWYEVVVLGILGIAQAAAIIPTLPAMKDGAESDNTDAVVVWFNIFLQLGLAVTPLVSSVMMDFVGYEDTVAAYGAVIAVYGTCAVVFALRNRGHVELSTPERKMRMSRTTSRAMSFEEEVLSLGSPSPKDGSIVRLDS